MSALYKFIQADRILFWSFLVSLVCIVLSLILILFSLQKLPDLIPLYNQLPWGPARLGKKLELFIPFILDLAIFVANVFLSKKFHEKIPLLSRMLAVTSFIASLLIFLFFARTIQLIV